jgi:protoheme ferro-lyase
MSTEHVEDTESDEEYHLDEDFNEVILMLSRIQETHDQALAGLQRIQQQLSQRIMITTDGITSDLAEVLRDLHHSALQEIEEKGESSFGSNMIDLLNRSTVRKI